MAISDKKKSQTLINLCAAAATQLKAMATQLETYRTAYQTQAVDPTGTLLEGNVAAVSTWIDNVRGVADAVVADSMIAAIVESHKNNALDQ